MFDDDDDVDDDDDDDDDEETVDVEKCLKSSPPSNLPTHLKMMSQLLELLFATKNLLIKYNLPR